MMGCWDDGVVEYWKIGILENWNLGVLEVWAKRDLYLDKFAVI